VSFGRVKAVCAPFEEKLADWCKEQGGWELEIVERSADTEGFAVVPHRWIVERTFGWLMRNRRLSKDYERKVQSSEGFMEVAMRSASY
jgi:putative transposase